MNLTIGATCANVPLVLQDPASLAPEARAQRRASLGRSHRAVGVDPRYLQLPEGQHLWFVHVVLDLAVHTGCLGFTKHLYEYALGADARDAERAVREYFAATAQNVDGDLAAVAHRACVGGEARARDVAGDLPVRAPARAAQAEVGGDRARQLGVVSPPWR